MMKADKARKIFVKCIFIIAIAGILAGVFLRGDRSSNEYLNYDEYDMLHVYDQMRIKQVIHPSDGFLVSVSLFCANIEPNMGVIEMELKDENGKRIHQAEIKTDTLETGTFNRFVINKSVEKKDYILSLTFLLNDGVDEDFSLGIMAVPEDKNFPQTGNCYFEGIEDGYNLALAYEMRQFPGIGLTLFCATLLIIFLFVAPDIRRMKSIQMLKDSISHKMKQTG